MKYAWHYSHFVKVIKTSNGVALIEYPNGKRYVVKESGLFYGDRIPIVDKK